MQDTPKIALYVVVGSPSPGTMRIDSRIQGQCLVILIDTSSTHNFLDVGLCSSLKLAIDIALAFDVKIANGATVRTLGAFVKTYKFKYRVITFVWISMCFLWEGVIWFWAINFSKHWD